MQEDYLKSQFDKLGQVLGKMLAFVLKLKQEENLSPGAELLENTFTNELNLDIDSILSLEGDNLISELVDERNYSIENLKALADILYHYSTSTLKITDSIKSREIAEKAIVIYEYVHLNSGSLAYFDLASRIKELRS